MKQTTLLALAIVTLTITSPIQADQAAYAVCIACHGVNGEGNVALNSPAIAGQEAWYVETQLKNYKSGVRGSHKDDIYGQQMAPMASILVDDAAVSSIASYISEMAPVVIPNTVEGNAEAGKALYIICSACHGADGKGLQALNSPNLLIQQDWYVARQLNNFKSGIRGTDPADTFGLQMQPMAMTLTSDQAVNDLVAYLNSLR